MGLQRKQGVPVKDGEQFDLSKAVDDFKLAVYQYTLREIGMEIRVSHVKRREIPNFVFPGGVRPSRPSKVSWVRRRRSEPEVAGNAQPDRLGEDKTVSDGEDCGQKRKLENDNLETDLRHAKSMRPCGGEVCEASPPFNNLSSSSRKCDNNIEFSAGKMESPAHIPYQNGQAEVLSGFNPGSNSLSVGADESSSKEAEKLALEKIMGGPYVSHQALPEELDELEDDSEDRHQVKGFSGNMKDSHMEPSIESASVAVPVKSSGGAETSTGLYNGGLEELEVKHITFACTCYFSVSNSFHVINQLWSPSFVDSYLWYSYDFLHFLLRANWQEHVKYICILFLNFYVHITLYTALPPNSQHIFTLSGKYAIHLVFILCS